MEQGQGYSHFNQAPPWSELDQELYEAASVHFSPETLALLDPTTVADLFAAHATLQSLDQRNNEHNAKLAYPLPNQTNIARLLEASPSQGNLCRTIAILVGGRYTILQGNETPERWR